MSRRALTSKPYAFTARNWEPEDIYSLDVFDSLGLISSYKFIMIKL